MSPAPQLAPPGSSSYASNTLHVGDGTWDSGRDDFLLPNLVGLNFATMRYNGMGNRFFTMAGYHSVIMAHGVMAAITFLAIIPAAIFILRFGGRRPPLSLRIHISLQILTLLLSTVVIILGFFAVGPERRLTNPHHGIGLALYLLIWFQVIGGWAVHHSEKRQRSLHIPLKVMLHHWLGRAIALLGIAQVALGLTLYGSPVSLFVLYALAVFALLLTYFILEWLHERRKSEYGNNTGSYYAEEVVEGRRPGRQGTGVGRLAAAGAAGVGLAALWRRRQGRRNSRPDVVGSEQSGTSYMYDDKDSIDERPPWGRRLLEIGAVGGGLAALKGIFGRRRNENDSVSDVGPYRPPLGGNQRVPTDSMSRIEEGRPPNRPMTPTGNSPGQIRPSHPLSQTPMTPGRVVAESDLSYYDDYTSNSPSRRDRRPHTFRDALAAGGTVFAVRSLFQRRRQRKEERRVEEMRLERAEADRLARMNSAGRYTGDGTPARLPRRNRVNSQSVSDMTEEVIDERRRPGPGMGAAIPAAGVGAAAAGALADRNRIRPVGQDPVIATPGPPTAMPSDVPPLPPQHRTDLESSGSEMYTSASGRQRRRHHLRNEAGAGLAGAAIGAAGAEAARRRHEGRNTDSVESPPVSVKVNVHPDGRHVTLRRLPPEEVAARRRRRNSSLGSSGADEMSVDPSWRRTEQLEAQQQAQADAAAAGAAPGPSTAYPPPPGPGTAHYATTQAVDPQTGQQYSMPAPPPIPGTAPSGITSPGTDTENSTQYTNNRRRRRAERAQQRLAREGRTGGTVEFT